MIFVDTSAWYARFASSDAHHAEAKAFHLSAPARFVTTDYVVDETLTLFKARRKNDRALHVGAELFSGQLAEIVYVTRGDINAAWRIFYTHQDKAWSFTDCVSFAVMKRLRIVEAFAFDEHFHQFGFATVRP